MAADGTIILKTEIDESGIDKGLSSIQGGISKAGKAFKVAGVAAAGAFIGVTTAAVKAKTEFEQTAAKASTLFGDVDVDAQKLNDTILSISSSTGMAATELNEALYSALSAGIPVTEDMTEATGFLENAAKLAKAGFTDVDTAISATAKTLNAYGMDVSEAERIQGILIQTQNKGITTVGELGASLAQVTPTAAAFGVSFENVGAALATMTAQGTPTAQSTTQLNSLIAELGKTGTTASKNLMTAAEGTQYAGMSFAEMTASGASLADILMLISDQADKDGVSMVDMFSSIEAGKAALALTSGEAATFNDNLAAMSDTAGLVDGAFNTMNDTVQGSIDQLKESWNNFLVALATPDADITASTDQLVESLGNVANNLLPLVGSVFGSVFNALPTPILVVAGAIGSIVAGITAYNAVVAVKNVLDDIQKIKTGEVAAAQIGLNAAMLASPITWVVAGIVALVAAFVILWNKCEGFRNFWIGLWDTIKSVAADVWDFIVGVFEAAWDTIKSIWDFVSPYFEAVWNTIKGIFAVVSAVLSGNWSDAWEAIKGIVATWVSFFSGIWNGIKSVFSAVGSWFSNIFSQAWNGIKNAFASVGTFFANVWSKIKSAFKFDQMLTIGKNIVQGLWNGIKNAKDWILGKIKSWCGSILNGIKAFFGIKSPSTVMRDEVGEMIPRGMAIGIEQAKGYVTKATKSLVTDTRSEVEKVLDSMNEDLLESEKKYAEESLRIEREKEEQEYKDKLNAAKDEDERNKIRAERQKKEQEKQTKDYLDSLKTAAEKERKIHDARRKDVEKAQSEIVDTYQKAADEMLASIDDLIKKQEALADKSSGYGSLMEDTIVIEDKFNKVHSPLEERNGVQVLSNLQKQTDELEKYYDLMTRLREREGMSYDLFDEIKNMSYDDSFEYAKRLMNLSDEKFAAYVESWKAKQETTMKITEGLFGDDEKVDPKRVLADITQQTNVLRDYYALLEGVKNRGNVPKEFFAALRDMGVDEGLEYANALLELSDEDFDAYIRAWEEKQTTSKAISKELYRDEADELSEEISSKFNEMAKSFFEVGENSADEFEQGFMSSLQKVFKNIKSAVDGAFSNVQLGSYGSGFTFKVPGLARGAVLPPNREFLAVVGDQKSGTNIEAPLDTIVEAMNIALARNGNARGTTEVVLELDGREFGRAVVEQGNRENRRIGTRLVTV